MIDHRSCTRLSLAVSALLLLPITGVSQQDTAVLIPAPAGSAVYVDPKHKEGNDRYGFAGAFRAGDFIYVSGVVAGAWSGETLDDEGLRGAIRGAFEEAGRTLVAAGSSYADVVDIVSFHVWDSPYYEGDKASQLDAVVDVKREFMAEPDPAWTAVGTTELVPDAGIVELRFTAHAPRSRK